MKKTIALLLTFLLLFTTAPPASVQAMPGKGRKVTAGSGRGAEGGGRGSDRDRARSADRDRDRAKSIKDPYGSPRGVQDPIRIARDAKDQYDGAVQDRRLQEDDQNATDSKRVYQESYSVGSKYFNQPYVKQFFDGVDDKFRLPPEQYERYKRNEPELMKLNDNAWGWLIRFVQLGAILKISFEPDAIKAVIQDARSDKLVSRLANNRLRIEQNGIEKLRVYAEEFNTLLREYTQRMGTPNPEVDDPSISDAVKALAHVATVVAVTIYDNVEFDGLTRGQSRKRLEEAVVGNYSLTREMFRKLSNEVAIRIGSGNSRYTKVISGAQYTTDIMTITSEEIKRREHYNQIYEERIRPLTYLLDSWDTELKALEKNGIPAPHVDILSSIGARLKHSKLYEYVNNNDAIIIGKISYNNQVQGITVGRVKYGEYYVDYSFTAPRNISANEGTYQGATNHLVSFVIQHIFDTYKQVQRVTAYVVNLYNVKSRLRLGFIRGTN